MGSSMSLPKCGIYDDDIDPLYFDPDVDSPEKYNYLMSEYQLSLLRPKVEDVCEKIKQVRYYTQPLHRCQLTKIFFSHAFIVLKTEKWWWSIEKEERGITIQRSKHLENVRDKCRRRNRITGITTGIDLVKKAPGKSTVNELLNRLGRADSVYDRSSEKSRNAFANFINALFY